MNPVNPNVPTFQVGASLVLSVAVLNAAGAAYPLTNTTVTAVARDSSGRAKAALQVAWIDRAAGLYELWAAGDGTTSGWAAGDYKVTVQYRELGAGTGGRDLVSGTESFAIRLEG